MKTKKAPTVNGNGHTRIEDFLTNDQKQIIVNEIVSRAQWARSVLDQPRRNLDAECQYPTEISISQYKEMYKRNPFGKRVCRVWSSECWKMWPDVYQVEDVDETEFESEWKKLQTRCRIYHYLKLADELSGIGHYGVLFLGVDDGQRLDSSIRTINERGERVEEEEDVNLMYLRAFDEEYATISAYETDQTNPRYGLPTEYEITFDNVDTKESLGKKQAVDRKVKVHWSRVIHIAPDCTTSLVWGTPRQEVVFNSLLDIRKVLGSSAEMFFKGGFPGLSFETHPDAITNSTFDLDSIKKQVERWESGLQRYFASLGLTVKSIQTQIEDPSKHIDVQIEAICTVMEIPKRVFLGSEIGELASTQDKATWNDRVHAKQEDHTTPIVVRPFVERLVTIGALPEIDLDELKVHWPDLNAPSGKEKADVAAKITDALYKYVVGGCYTVIPPEQFLSMILRLDVAEVTAIMEAAMESVEGENDMDPMVIKEEQKLEQQEEQQEKQFQRQKELTQVKQKQQPGRTSARQPTQRTQPTNNMRRKKKKKRKKATSYA